MKFELCTDTVEGAIIADQRGFNSIELCTALSVGGLTPNYGLVQRCVEGDARAWEGIVTTYTGRLLNMAYHYTSNYSVSQELTQDIFLKVYENLAAFRPESGSLQNWIMPRESKRSPEDQRKTYSPSSE